MAVHELSRVDARRIAVRAQLLDGPRPSDLLEVVWHLNLLKIDPAAPIAPSADLVLWSRLGPAYDPGDLRQALHDHVLLEHAATVRPADYLALVRADMADWPGRGTLKQWQRDVRDWVRANDRCRLDILARLEESGPLRSGELPDTCAVPWRSSGWTNDKNVRRMLDFMVARGEVALAGRKGRDPLWDLASRIYPDDPVIEAEEAERERNRLRLRALGIARAKAKEVPFEPDDVGQAGETAVVEGVDGSWQVDPAQLDRLGSRFSGRAALLSPLDWLVRDRLRTLELFGFDYQLEMYKPAAKRRWGYYALPILHGDRLIGKLDAKADRTEGVLRIHAVHEDVAFSTKVRADVDREIESLGEWLGLRLDWD